VFGMALDRYANQDLQFCMSSHGHRAVLIREHSFLYSVLYSDLLCVVGLISNGHD
jgi:hypothetical protein